MSIVLGPHRISLFLSSSASILFTIFKISLAEKLVSILITAFKNKSCSKYPTGVVSYNPDFFNTSIPSVFSIASIAF